MRELRLEETKAISGAGIIGKIVGGIIIKKAINAAMKHGNNAPAIPGQPHDFSRHKMKLPEFK